MDCFKEKTGVRDRVKGEWGLRALGRAYRLKVIAGSLSQSDGGPWTPWSRSPETAHVLTRIFHSRERGCPVLTRSFHPSLGFIRFGRT